MGGFIDVLITAGLAGVAAIIVAGLINMRRNDGTSTSQMLMRWRVALQFVTVALVMLGYYLVG